MKITEIEVHRLSVPLKKPYALSAYYGILTAAEPVVVKVRTDEGIVGYGEADPMPLFTGESPETVLALLRSHIAPALIGCDPLNVAAITRVMDGCVRGMPLAKSAIDMAVHDILGKSLGVPLDVLLGGRLRDTLPIMGSIGIDTPEVGAEEALEIQSRGYHSLMVKVGGEDVAFDAERTWAVRNAVGDQFPLIADANQGWSAVQAIRYGKLVDGCGVALLEQPVRADNIAGFVKVRDAVDIPLSADESVLTLNTDTKYLVTEHVVDVVSIKVTKHGGIYRTKQIIDFAAAFHVDCLFNSMIEEGITQAASLALGLTTENLYPFGHAYFSPFRLAADISTFSDQVSGGTVAASDLPGLGVRIHEAVLEEFSDTSFLVSQKNGGVL